MNYMKEVLHMYPMDKRYGIY